MVIVSMSSAEPRSSRAEILVVADPENGQAVGEVTVADADAVERTLAAAHEASRRTPSPAHARSDILARVAQRVRAEHDAFAGLIAREGIKTIREAATEVDRCVTTLELSAEEGKRIEGQVLAMDQVRGGAGKLGLTTRRAAGVVVALTPFNDPLNLVAHKVGPAVALGAPIVLKPHPETPLSAARLHELFLEAGLAPDMFQVVHGGARVGTQLVADDRPRVISFTGGQDAGMAVARRAGFKKLMMELGGVGVVLVADDADVELAARALHSAAFWAAGQNCVHAQRILVDRSIESALTDKLLTLAHAMKLGPKLDSETDMGCCIDAGAAQRVLQLVNRSLSAGAELLTGGTADGTRVTPTWLRCSKNGNPLALEEVFGPVGLLERVEDFDDALHRVRDAPAALHAAIFTNRIDRAMAAHEAANAATVLVNESTDFRIDAMPFGGVGNAGMEREGVRYAIDALAESRLLILPNAGEPIG